MSTDPPPASADLHAPMRRNLRLLSWWWVLRWAWFGEAIWVIYLTRERGLTLGEVFVFEALHSAVVIAAEIPTGIVADRYGRRLSLVIGTAVTVVGYIAFGVGSGLMILLAAYVILGIGEAFMSGADSALLYDSLHAEGRSGEFTHRMGRLNAYGTAAIAAFTLSGAAIAQWLPLWVPMVLSGVVSLPAVLIAWRFAEPAHERERPSFLGTGRQALRGVVRSRALWAAIVLMALGMVGIVAMSVTMQLVIVGYGAPLWALGPLVGAQMGLSAVGSLLAAPAKRRLGLRGSFLLMSVGGALSLLAGASGVPWLFPVFILPSVTFNVIHVQVTNYLAQRVPEERRATTISIGSMMASTANVAGALSIGASADPLGLRATLTAAGLVLAGASAVAFALWLRAGDHESEPGKRASTFGETRP
ncbi:MAG: MFS transporter [Chloroflexi bacterium]|nr:MFS transporter [Chloroflexota bacterium]